MRVPNIERMTEHVDSFRCGEMPYGYTDEEKLKVLNAALFEVAKLELSVKRMKMVITAQKADLVEFMDVIRSYREE